ncbi:MAG: hypothetical protein K8I00_10370, partial [Candidatus Omnitrophica bacterium]|nr:hypothetical protein [Candidatus Omnitrophota bacterium]
MKIPICKICIASLLGATVILSTVACRPDHPFARDPLMDHMLQGYSLPEKSFPISDTGKTDVLDYTQYGEFEKAGQEDYRYKIVDRKKLKADVGVGVYPNQNAVRKEENYAAMKEQGLLRGTHWEVLDAANPQLAFFMWATAHEAPGVKAFFTARILEDAGHIVQAIKSYYSAVVHFPRAVGWAADQSFVWYIAPAAMGEIQRLCRDYPALELEYQDFFFEVTNGGDTDLTNDVIRVNPGRIIKKTLSDKLAELPGPEDLSIKQVRGRGEVKLVQFRNGHWQLVVGQEPFFVRGITYGPTRIGIGPQNDPNFDARWMYSDENNNGIIDAPYEAWVDANRNGRQDEDEPAVGDFQLLADMGVNAIRFYIPNKST